MGLDVVIRGTVGRGGMMARSPTSRRLVETAAKWFRERHEGMILGEWSGEDDGAAVHMVDLFPGAEPIRITSEATGLIELAARTSAAGPGFHQLVCREFKELARSMGIQVSAEDADQADDTGYYASGDRAELERHMLAWLRALGQSVCEHGCDSNSICMPMRPFFRVDGQAVTPLGPRGRDWFESIANNDQAARGFFPWWGEDHDARVTLNRALLHMWSDVRWIAPPSEEDAALHQRVHDLLAETYTRDPELDFPWREWSELLALSEIDYELAPMVERQAAALDDAPLIGYRRGDVLIPDLPGGWTIEIPGRMAETTEDDTWVAYDHERIVRATTYEAEPPPGVDWRNALDGAPLMDGGEPVAWSEPDRIGRGWIGRLNEDGREFWQLAGHIAAPGALALVSVCFDDPADRDWAMQVWRSVRPRPRDSAPAGAQDRGGQ